MFFFLIYQITVPGSIKFMLRIKAEKTHQHNLYATCSISLDVCLQTVAN